MWLPLDRNLHTNFFNDRGSIVMTYSCTSFENRRPILLLLSTFRFFVVCVQHRLLPFVVAYVDYSQLLTVYICFRKSVKRFSRNLTRNFHRGYNLKKEDS